MGLVLLLGAASVWGQAIQAPVFEECLLQHPAGKPMAGAPMVDSRLRLIRNVAREAGGWVIHAPAGDFRSPGIGPLPPMFPPPAVSPDGLRIAAAVRRDHWFVTEGGRDLGPFDEVLYFLFSPDSRRFAFYARRGKTWRVVLDGVEQPEFPGESLWLGALNGAKTKLAFSPDSQRFAYLAFSKTTMNRGHLVVDGKPSGEYEQFFSGPVFSPDSKQVAVVCWQREGLFNSWRSILLDGKEIGRWESVNFAFRPPGWGLAVLGTWNNQIEAIGLKLVFGEKKKFTTVRSSKGTYGAFADGPHFSEDGQHWAYALGDSDSIELFVDGRSVYFGEGPLNSWRFSADFSRSAALLDRRGGPRILDLKFGTDPATGLKTLLQRQEYQAGPDKLLSGTTELVLSPGGRHLAYIKTRLHWKTQEHWVVIDGQEGPHYEVIDRLKLVWESEDQIAFVAARNFGWFRVVQRAPAQEAWTTAAP